ncbi:MAG: NAD(P)/FAD-dependent oxidoreductase [Firmicutes bacterium]|nr:NAD(P)/FAD-dependent oxidoreductase [Bacillota bacterium]
MSLDVAVIGAGLGGLSAALKLASEGARVLLLEQHNLPGGFATSFVRGRFEFEVSLHELSDVGPSDNKGAVRRFLEDEAGVEVEFLPVPEAYHLILPESGINIRIPFGVQPFIETIAGAVPGSLKPLTRYLKLCREVARALSFIGRSGGAPDMGMLLERYPAFVTTAGYTVSEVTEKFGFPEKALQMIYPYWSYMGVPVSRMSFTLFAVMLYSYISRGAYIPRHNSHGLAAAMDARIRELGGEVRYNTRVEKILVEDGRAVGVETAEGLSVSAKAVVANLSPNLVYGKLVHPRSAVPERAVKLLNARRLGASALVLYLGLDAPPEALNLESYGYFVGPSMDTERAYENFFRFEPPQMQAVICLNRANPECSPPGTTILSATSLAGPQAWDGVAAEQYYSVKREMAEAMIEQLSGYLGAPLREHIEEIEVATPQTFARYTGACRGAIYGYEQDPWDSLVARTMAAPTERFIKGLEFTGGFAFMGHGYAPSIISGRAAALSVLHRLSRSR